MKPIESVYLAGKMQSDQWRFRLFDRDENFDTDHANKLGYNPLTMRSSYDWPSEDLVTVCGLRYTGPFFIDVNGGHGYRYIDGDKHGSNISLTEDACFHGDPCQCGLEDKRNLVQALCLQSIANADLVYAWVDCTDCYGTIAEIAYANALGKAIWITGPRRYDDLWFVYGMADQVSFVNDSTADTIFRNLLHAYRAKLQYLQLHFNSPIEQAFWHEWLAYPNSMSYQLVSQHPIGKYRADFAHIPSMTVIELDGFASHSSTEDIANDRKRQRFIEEMGWHVIRFGGKEVHNNVQTCVEEVYRLIEKRTSNKEGAL